MCVKANAQDNTNAHGGATVPVTKPTGEGLGLKKEKKKTIDPASKVPGLDTKQTVASAASVSTRCVENWMKQKRIPFVKLSARCVRFDLKSVLAALRKFEIKEVRK